MLKASLYRTVGWVAVFATCLLSHVSHAKDQSIPIRMRIGGVRAPTGGDTLAMQAFQAAMARSAGGAALNIELYPDSTLGRGPKMAEQVKDGKLECVYESLGIIDVWHPLAKIEGVPYLYRDADHFLRTWRGAIGDEVTETIARDIGVRFIGHAFRGFRQILVNRKVSSPADLRGLKIRVPFPGYVDALRALGTDPVVLEFEETAAAIASNQVDGLEHAPLIMKEGDFYQMERHLALTNHIAEVLGFMCNERWYRSLPKDTQTAIQHSARVSSDWYRKFIDSRTPELFREFEAAGIAIETLDLTELRRNAMKAHYDPKLTDLIQRIRSAP